MKASTEVSGTQPSLLERISQQAVSPFMQSVGLEFDHIAPDEVRAHVEATAAHHTPWGVVHGGFYATIIESVATVGAVATVESSGQIAVGVNNQTDFLRPHRTGRLDVRGTPLQQGRSLQLWLVEITNSEHKVVARGQVRLFNQAAA